MTPSFLSRFLPRGSGRPSGGPARLTPAEAHRLAEEGQAVLLDVREVPEWTAGHAPGAVHLPLSQLTAGAALPPSASGKRVVAVCRSGNRSQQAARLLADRGVDATDMTGGMNAWAGAGLPVRDEHGNPGVVA